MMDVRQQEVDVHDFMKFVKPGGWYVKETLSGILSTLKVNFHTRNVFNNNEMHSFDKFGEKLSLCRYAN